VTGGRRPFASNNDENFEDLARVAFSGNRPVRKCRRRDGSVRRERKTRIPSIDFREKSEFDSFPPRDIVSPRVRRFVWSPGFLAKTSVTPLSAPVLVADFSPFPGPDTVSNRERFDDTARRARRRHVTTKFLKSIPESNFLQSFPVRPSERSNISVQKVRTMSKTK